MKIKGFFFDLDGTLIDSMDGHYESWSKILDLKYNYKLNKKTFMSLEGTKPSVLISNLLANANIKISKSKMEELISEKDLAYKKNNKIIFYPNTIKVIKFLKSKNIKTAIVTAGSKNRVLSTLPNFFLKLFDVVITGDDCKYGKPNPEPYLKAIKKLKLKTENCCVLENAPLGIESGLNANLFIYGITNTLNKKYLSKANVIISDISELEKIKYD